MGAKPREIHALVLRVTNPWTFREQVSLGTIKSEPLPQWTAECVHPEAECVLSHFSCVQLRVMP